MALQSAGVVWGMGNEWMKGQTACLKYQLCVSEAGFRDSSSFRYNACLTYSHLRNCPDANSIHHAQIQGLAYWGGPCKQVLCVNLARSSINPLCLSSQPSIFTAENSLCKSVKRKTQSLSDFAICSFKIYCISIWLNRLLLLTRRWFIYIYSQCN